MGRLDDLLECLIVAPGDLGRMQAELSGLDLNSQHATAGTALMFASAQGNIEAVRLFLKRGADPNAVHHKVQLTALHLASGSGVVDVCEELIRHSANLEARDNQGWTPLMFCAQEGRLDCLELLLKNGADVNAADFAGRNSLMQAARCGFPEIAIRLLEAGANVHAASGWANSLIVAATEGKTQVGEILLDHGALIDELNLKEGYSALMMAAIGGHQEFVEMLIRRGANVNLVTEWNVCAMTMAMRGNQESIQTLLKNVGASEPKEVPMPIRFPYGWVGDPILCQQMRQLIPDSGADG